MDRRLIFVGACIAFVGLPRAAATQIPDAAPIMLPVVAEKLGVKPAPGAPHELELGRSATGVLAQPEKLAAYGFAGLHEGARVTFTCTGSNRVRIEAEEMEPVAVKSIVTLQVAEDGSMSKAPERPAPKPPAP